MDKGFQRTHVRQEKRNTRYKCNQSLTIAKFVCFSSFSDVRSLLYHTATIQNSVPPLTQRFKEYFIGFCIKLHATDHSFLLLTLTCLRLKTVDIYLSDICLDGTIIGD